MNKGRYIVNGEVKRVVIAADIANRQLTGIDVEHIANDPTIKQDFFGKLESLKRPKNEWNRDYVNYLMCAVAAECFNREYLLYLDRVAEHVAREKSRKKMITVILIVALAIIVAILVYRLTHNSAEQHTDARDMTAIIEVQPEHTGETSDDAEQEILNI